MRPFRGRLLRRSPRVLAGCVAAASLLAGCGSSGKTSQVLDLAAKCSAASPAGTSPSDAGGHYCFTPGAPGGQSQDPSSAAAGVAGKFFPVCNQLGSDLRSVTPSGLSTFTTATVGLTSAGVALARCNTDSGDRYLFVTVLHDATPGSNIGAPQQLSDGSTLYSSQQPSVSVCERFYPDHWAVALVVGEEAPDIGADCPTASAVVHAWLTGS